MQEFKRVACNEQVVARIKLYLEAAEKGRMNFVGLVACEGDKYTSDFAGDASALYMANFGLDQLKNRILQGIEGTHLKPVPNNGAANMFHFDISVEPVNFDFIVWLATCELIRRREGAPAPLRIGFSVKDDHSMMSRESRDYRAAFLANVMGPALDFFGAINDPEAVTKGRRSNMYTIKDLVEAAKNGEEIPKIVPPQASVASVAAYLKGRKPVVITLRESKDWEHRNSNILAWTKFAMDIEAQGEDVIFVRDTAIADEPLTGFETFPMASKDLHTRVALYEQAKCNMFVSNGPGFLAQIGMRPWLMFVTIREGEPAPASRPGFWEKNQGIVPGQQLPWATPLQRFVWEDDTYENIMKAWKELKETANGEMETEVRALPQRAGHGVGVQGNRSANGSARPEGLQRPPPP